MEKKKKRWIKYESKERVIKIQSGDEHYLLKTRASQNTRVIVAGPMRSQVPGIAMQRNDI